MALLSQLVIRKLYPSLFLRQQSFCLYIYKWFLPEGQEQRHSNHVPTPTLSFTSALSLLSLCLGF